MTLAALLLAYRASLACACRRCLFQAALSARALGFECACAYPRPPVAMRSRAAVPPSPTAPLSWRCPSSLASVLVAALSLPQWRSKMRVAQGCACRISRLHACAYCGVHVGCEDPFSDVRSLDGCVHRCGILKGRSCAPSAGGVAFIRPPFPVELGGSAGGVLFQPAVSSRAPLPFPSVTFGERALVPPFLAWRVAMYLL